MCSSDLRHEMAKGDMFLKVEGSKTGTIKGESSDKTHPDEIDVLGWSWGMRASTAMGASGPASRASLESLIVRKMADSATTALMSVLRNNELIKKATLTVRKAGANPVEYMVVTLESARLTSFDISSDDASADRMVETIAFSFQKINVDYYAQDPTGLRKGGSSFTAETASA